MKSLVLRFVFTALIAIGLSLPMSAQTPSGPTKPGVIKAGKVEGDVYRLTADGQSLKLKQGDTLIETDTVRTDKGALVVLVFMNGSSVKLGGESKLEIKEFKMDPLEEDLVLSKVKDAEPSVSKTSLNLAYGEMVGNVKHLNKDRGSSYNITTPVGAAGIRGTTFRIVFRPTGNGNAFTFQLQTAEGHVVFEGAGQTTGAPVDVLQDKEVVVTAEATVDATTGTVQVTKVDVPTAASTLSDAAKATITEAVTTAITQAVQQTVITTGEQQQTANTPTTNNSGGTPPPTDSGNTTSAEKKDSTSSSDNSSNSNSNPTSNTGNNSNTSNTPPPTTSRPSNLTPGAGG